MVRLCCMMCCAAVVAVAFAGCSDDSTPPAAPSAPPIRLDAGPAAFTVEQRSTTAIPGSDGKLLLSIDDITAGQVMMSIIHAGGAPIVGPVSMKSGEFLPFTIENHEYQAVLNNLTNELIGQDSATFTIAEADGAALSEDQKIDLLIQHIASLQGAVFIRNDGEHSATEASEHLASKLAALADEIVTAEDFIEKAASRSSLTGKPYRIRLADGREVETAQYLREQLAQIETRQSHVVETR